MAKIYGLFGAMTGKLADTVMSVRNGEQIARKYQPVVYNPSTPAQVAVRAKLKLLSQLSAVMAPVIAIPRDGAVSSRNLFTKKNYAASSYSENNATINLSAVSLTDSVVALPALVAEREGNTMSLSLQRAATDVSRVVYCSFIHDGDEIRYIGSSVVSEGGEGNLFPTSFQTLPVEYVVYAYGVRDNTEAARVKFGELTVLSAETIARIVTSRTLLNSDITLTETRAAIAPAPGA